MAIVLCECGRIRHTQPHRSSQTVKGLCEKCAKEKRIPIISKNEPKLSLLSKKLKGEAA